MNFFIALDSMSRRSSDFEAANLFGSVLRSIQRVTVKTRTSATIIFDRQAITTRLSARLDLIFSESTDPIRTASFSVCFDGTNVPAKLQLSVAHRAIIGAVAPREMIDVVKNLMNPSSLC